jgi:GPH family glycoside/pentoside/hexuronide:cation symporter
MSSVDGVPPTPAPFPPAAGQPIKHVAPLRKIYTAPWWQIHAWGVGSIASYFMYEQFYLINNIHTTTFKVNPAIVGVILAIPRLFDGILDPLIGHWSDNMRSRWGRRRPFLLVSAIVGALLASTMFWMSPEWSQWLKGVILAFSAVTLFTACGTYDMAYTALGYELSDEYADRSRIQAIKGVYWSVVGIIGGYLITMAGNLHHIGDFLFGAPPHNWLAVWATWRPMLLDNSVKSGGNEVIGFRVLSGVVSLLILISVLFPLFWSKERFVKINAARQHVNIWKALGATMKCRPFVVILIINFTKGAGTLPRNLFFYIGTYYVCAGDKEHYSKIMAGDFAVWGLVIAIGVWLLTHHQADWEANGLHRQRRAGSAPGRGHAVRRDSGAHRVLVLVQPLFPAPGHDSECVRSGHHARCLRY